MLCFVPKQVRYLEFATKVDKPEEYLYSSARDYKQTTKCGLPDLVFI